MPPYFDTVKLWLHKTANESRAVQGEASMESLRRFPKIALVVLLINLIYIVSFFQLSIEHTDTLKARHAHAIIVTHCIVAAAMVILAWCAHWQCRHNQSNNSLAIALQILICSSGMAFAIAITAIAQMINQNMTPFVIVTLLTAMLSLMRPVIAIPFFLLSYMAFYVTMGITQIEPSQLQQLRIGGRDVIIISLVVSVIVWRQYVAAVLLRRELASSHQALAKKQIELEFLATHDSLTGLINRREFMRQAEIELIRSRRDPTPTHLIILDIDHFKVINDQYGHPEGDLVLMKMAAMLTASVREMDIVARLGGEEFILLLPNTSKEAAIMVAEKIRAHISATVHEAQGDAIEISASFGVTGLSVGQAALLEDLYLAADRALYQAKHQGRNRVDFVAADYLELAPQYVRPTVDKDERQLP